MQQGWQRRWAGGLAIVALVMGGGEEAIAQIVPDNTLGTKVFGVCTGIGGTCGITGGTQRGGNLFHSFQQFSLPSGDIAGFVVAPNVQNAIVRVTGQGAGFVSTINGTIATFNQTNTGFQLSQPVNFFLMNPNGITFGANARLFIGGSFLATTANRMVFQDGTQFSTSDPAPLLTVSVPIGLQFGPSPGNIQMNDSILTAGQNSLFSNFALVGGNIVLNNTQIGLQGGRLELTGVGVPGVVGLDLENNALRLTVPDGLTRADVALANHSILSMNTTSGTDIIAINARNLNLSGGNAGSSGIVATSFMGQAGDIVLNATGTITLSQGSLIGNSDSQQAIGNGGNIRIQTGSLSATENSGIGTSHLGQGDSGSIFIDASDTVAFDGNSVFITNAVDKNRDPSAHGNSGDIWINTGLLSLIHGAHLSILNGRPGISGNITINARDAIFLDGEAANGVPTSISSTSGIGTVGNSGNIHLTTGSLTATNGANIDTSTLGQGNAGNITIAARDAVTFDGRGSTRLVNGIFGSPASGISSDVVSDGVTIGRGNGGAIQITAGSLAVTNGAAISAVTEGQGNAGNINLNVRNRITVDGSGGGFSSTIDGEVAIGATGNGGDIRVATNLLALTNGGILNATTNGQGNGGNITINATDQAIVDGVGSNGQDSTIQSAVNAGVSSQGMPFQALGKGGDIALTAGSLRINNEGFLSTSAFSLLGQAGNIAVNVTRIQLDNNGDIDTSTASGNGGNITLNASNWVLLRRDSFITATAGSLGTGQGSGNGGNILINTPFLISAPLENNDIYANAFSGSGGTVTINAIGIYWFTPRSRADLERVLGTTDSTLLTPRSLLTNDITAISRGNPTLNGVVTLHTPDTDPSRGLTPLPTALVDASSQIAQRCPQRGSSQEASSFYITGRGGLPLRPGDAALSDYPTGTVQTIADQPAAGQQRTNADKTPVTPEPTAPEPAIVEAQGWAKDANGNLQLVAQSSMSTLIVPRLTSVGCR